MLAGAAGHVQNRLRRWMFARNDGPNTGSFGAISAREKTCWLLPREIGNSPRWRAALAQVRARWNATIKCRRLRRLCREGFQSLPVRSHNSYVETPLAPILERIVDNAHLVSGIQRMKIPASASEPARTHALKTPLLRLTGLIRNDDPDECMGLSPLIFFDRANEGFLGAPLKHRRGMVGRC